MELKFKHTILLVDDEGSITKSLQRLLQREGYNIMTASNGREGIEMLEKSKKAVSLIVSDQRMPGMKGTQFLEEAKKLLPDAVRILLTGYSDMDAIIEAVNKGEIHRYLTKPWDDRDFLLQIKESLKHYELFVENRRLLALTKKQNKELKDHNALLEKKVKERTKEIVQKNKELESSLFNSVRAFASLMEMNTPNQAGHGRRVALLSREITKNMDFPEKEITNIEIASLLHDIGKMGLPKKLLDYNGKKWSEGEMYLYKQHPLEGQTAVGFIKNLQHVGILIRSHHERYDGQGYPDGLSNEEIHIGARIIAVADAYDKIVYLKANVQRYINEFIKASKYTQDHLSKDELLQQAAIHHLKTNAFSLYDPDIVNVFLAYLNAKGVQVTRNKTVSLDELEAGMTLTRSLYTSKGRFLLPHNTILSREHIEKLNIIHRRDPIGNEIYIRED